MSTKHTPGNGGELVGGSHDRGASFPLAVIRQIRLAGMERGVESNERENAQSFAHRHESAEVASLSLFRIVPWDAATRISQEWEIWSRIEGDSFVYIPWAALP